MTSSNRSVAVKAMAIVLAVLMLGSVISVLVLAIASGM